MNDFSIQPLVTFVFGAVHKRRSHPEGVCPVQTRRRGSSGANIRTFWCKKLRIFRNLWCVHTDKGGLSQCRHFSDKGEGSIFNGLVQTSFMDGFFYYFYV